MPYLLMLCLALAGTSALAETYRWSDPAGKTVISDTPPPGKTKGLVKTGDKPEAGDGQSYATKKAAADFPVTLYTGLDCTDPCIRGRELLSGRGVPYSEKLLQKQEDADELKALVGDAVVPVLKVGRQVQRGFEAGAWNNLLDLAGYPKTTAKASGRGAQ